MKVMAFNARPDERAFFDHFSQSLDMDLTLQKDTLTLDNVALTVSAMWPCAPSATTM